MKTDIIYVKYQARASTNPFIFTPRRFSVHHFNNRATQTPDINSKRKVRVRFVLHIRMYELQKTLHCQYKEDVQRKPKRWGAKLHTSGAIQYGLPFSDRLAACPLSCKQFIF